MRSTDFISESKQPGEWVYHASHVPGKDTPGGTAKWLKSIIEHGLRPSTTGYMGPGTYFAYDKDGGYYHVDPEDAIVLRARWADLVKLYGLYPGNKDGIQRSGDELVIPGSVPGNLLEVEYFEDEWWKLRDALQAETRS